MRILAWGNELKEPFIHSYMCFGTPQKGEKKWQNNFHFTLYFFM